MLEYSDLRAVLLDLGTRKLVFLTLKIGGASNVRLK